jgi:two-component system, sensor histidine kinase and response regulator
MTRVLIIEDDTLIRGNIAEALSYEGFAILEAENGRIGLQMARDYLPDLIISDVMMPEMDGYEVLTHLRSDPGTASIPFIFTTARIDQSSRRQGMDLGADDYLTKPFAVQELLSAVNTRLRKHALLVEEYEQKLESLRGQLLSSLPHELRTPLTGIIGYAELLMLEGDDLDGSQVMAMATNIHKAGQRLSRLIENYLLYAQIEILRSDPDRVRLLQSNVVEQPAYIITEVIQEVAARAGRQTDVELVIEETGAIMVSQDSLHKITSELVDNAMKFSRQGTPVQITVNAHDAVFIMDIVDHGRGMTPEQIKNIALAVQFDRKLYEQQGFGLGLVIAKRLAELHRGEVRIESVIDTFTRVRVTLPLKPA